MGSSSSKPVRKLGSAASSVARSGSVSGSGSAGRPTSRPAPSPSASPAANEAAAQDRAAQKAAERAAKGSRLGRNEGASTTKSRAIMEDGSDPQFLQKLNQLGPVQVPKSSMQYKPSNQMLNILAARERTSAAEGESDSPSSISSITAPSASPSNVRNRLSAPTLINLLDERKNCTTRKELEDLAVGYDIDLEVLEGLAKFVNSPSISGRVEEIRERGPEDGEEGPPKVRAVWTEPNIDNRVEESRRLG